MMGREKNNGKGKKDKEGKIFLYEAPRYPDVGEV
jgi:hypothetical protein